MTTIMATIQRINIIGSREGSRNRRRLKANQTGKKFRVGIKSNISTNRNNLISGVDRCIHLNAMKKTTITRDRKSGSAGMPRPISYAVFCLKKKKKKIYKDILIDNNTIRQLYGLTCTDDATQISVNSPSTRDVCY